MTKEDLKAVAEDMVKAYGTHCVAEAYLALLIEFDVIKAQLTTTEAMLDNATRALMKLKRDAPFRVRG